MIWDAWLNAPKLGFINITHAHPITGSLPAKKKVSRKHPVKTHSLTHVITLYSPVDYIAHYTHNEGIHPWMIASVIMSWRLLLCMFHLLPVTTSPQPAITRTTTTERTFLQTVDELRSTNRSENVSLRLETLLLSLTLFLLMVKIIRWL